MHHYRTYNYPRKDERHERETTMIKALVLIARFAALKVQLACTKDNAKKFRLICEFEKKCK